MKILETNVLDRKEDKIFLDKSIDQIRLHVLSGNPVFVRGMLSGDEVEHLRFLSRKMASDQKVSNPPITTEAPNYHRIDNNHPKSKVKNMLHLYSFFYWNPESKPVVNYFKRQFKLRNILSNLPENYALDRIENGMISVPLVQQYPRGGGYMQEHQDPDVGQKVIINTILSSIPKDFEKGGLFCRDDSGNKVYIDPLLNPGDSIIFYPQTRHGADPIDPSFELDWNRDDGRWMCFSTLVTLSSLQGKDDGTAGMPIYS